MSEHADSSDPPGREATTRLESESPGDVPPPSTRVPTTSASGHPPARPSTARWMGLLVVAVALAGAAVSVALLFRRRPPPPVVPVALERLPPDTRYVDRVRLADALALELGIAPSQLPEQALWGHFAKVACGGEDVFELLVASAADQRSARGANGLAFHLASHAVALRCGRDVARAAGREVTSSTVALADPAQPASLQLFDLGLTALPATVAERRATNDPPHFRDTTCRVPFGSPAACTQGVVLARLDPGTVWGSGALPFVEAFAARIPSAPGAGPVALGRAVALAEQVASADFVAAGVGQVFSNVLLQLHQDALLPLLDEPAQALHATLREALDVWAVGRRVDREGQELRFVGESASEAQARAAEDALRAYFDAVSEALPSAASAAAAAQRPDGYPEVAWAAMGAWRSMSHRALLRPVIRRQGRRVELLLSSRADAQELVVLGALSDWRQGHAALAAAILQRIVDGQTPAGEELGRLVGPRFTQAFAAGVALRELGWDAPLVGMPLSNMLPLPGGGEQSVTSVDGVERVVVSFSRPRADVERAVRAALGPLGWTLSPRADGLLAEREGERFLVSFDETDGRGRVALQRAIE